MIDKGWVAAGDLAVGDEVFNLDGTTSTILGSGIEVLDEPILVYNLEVEDFHSYFVGCVPILAHNKCSHSRENWGSEHGKNNPKHNNAIEDELDWAYVNGASDLRKNQPQVDLNGARVYSSTGGYRKPDASYVLNGNRYNTNYVSNPNSLSELQRELAAFLSMLNNDPNAINCLKIKYWSGGF